MLFHVSIMYFKETEDYWQTQTVDHHRYMPYKDSQSLLSLMINEIM